MEVSLPDARKVATAKRDREGYERVAKMNEGVKIEKGYTPDQFCKKFLFKPYYSEGGE